MKRFLSLAVLSILAGAGVLAQSPVIVQPANAPAPVQQQGAQTKQDNADVAGAIKSLQEMKAGNQELLQKQQATLQALDALQQQAEQLRIYTRRS